MNEPLEFHKHLDECEHCRKNPFGLCPTGQKLLLQDVNDIELSPDFPDLGEEQPPDDPMPDEETMAPVEVRFSVVPNRADRRRAAAKVRKARREKARSYGKQRK